MQQVHLKAKLTINTNTTSSQGGRGIERVRRRKDRRRREGGKVGEDGEGRSCIMEMLG